MKKKIAITGGIGSGKSLVLEILRQQGFSCFSCDEIYAELVKEPSYIQTIAGIFPGVVVNGVIDKKQLGVVVFHDNTAREKLNTVAHKEIMAKLYRLMEEANGELVFAEVPLLFEGNYENHFDEVIVVMRSKEERVSSVCTRDDLSKCEVEARISAQFDYENIGQKINQTKQPIHILQNKGDKEELYLATARLVKQIM